MGTQRQWAIQPVTNSMPEVGRLMRNAGCPGIGRNGRSNAQAMHRGHATIGTAI